MDKNNSFLITFLMIKVCDVSENWVCQPISQEHTHHEHAKSILPQPLTRAIYFRRDCAEGLCPLKTKSKFILKAKCSCKSNYGKLYFEITFTNVSSSNGIRNWNVQKLKRDLWVCDTKWYNKQPTRTFSAKFYMFSL